jgi:hypothetical protein
MINNNAQQHYFKPFNALLKKYNIEFNVLNKLLIEIQADNGFKTKFEEVFEKELKSCAYNNKKYHKALAQATYCKLLYQEADMKLNEKYTELVLQTFQLKLT